MNLTTQIIKSLNHELNEADTHQQYIIIKTTVALLKSLKVKSPEILEVLKRTQKLNASAANTIDTFIQELYAEFDRELCFSVADIHYLLTTLRESLPIDKNCEPCYFVENSKYGKIMFVINGKFFHFMFHEQDFYRPLDEVIDTLIADTFEELKKENNN